MDVGPGVAMNPCVTLGGLFMRIQLCLILASSLFLTACGGVGSGAAGTTDADAAAAVQRVNSQMAQVKAAAVKAQTSLASAQNALSLITNADGSLKYSIFLGINVSTLGADLGTCISSQFNVNQIIWLPQDIANAMKCILDDVTIAVKSAKDDIGTAEASLAAAMATLPAGSPQLAEIQALMSQLTSIQSTYVSLVHQLASQVQLAVNFLNQLPALATGVCPMPFPGLNLICGAAASLFLNPLISEITSFQLALATL
jgi:hypothetical protein